MHRFRNFHASFNKWVFNWIPSDSKPPQLCKNFLSILSGFSWDYSEILVSDWYHRHHVSQFFQLSSKVQVFGLLFFYFHFHFHSVVVVWPGLDDLFIFLSHTYTNQTQASIVSVNNRHIIDWISLIMIGSGSESNLQRLICARYAVEKFIDVLFK